MSWAYWLGFMIVTVLLFAGPWLCAVFEERADQRDLEIWMQMPGATR